MTPKLSPMSGSLDALLTDKIPDTWSVGSQTGKPSLISWASTAPHSKNRHKFLNNQFTKRKKRGRALGALFSTFPFKLFFKQILSLKEQKQSLSPDWALVAHQCGQARVVVPGGANLPSSAGWMIDSRSRPPGCLHRSSLASRTFMLPETWLDISLASHEWHEWVLQNFNRVRRFG